jgi:hypothetical protein
MFALALGVCGGLRYALLMVFSRRDRFRAVLGGWVAVSLALLASSAVIAARSAAARSGPTRTPGAEIVDGGGR